MDKVIKNYEEEPMKAMGTKEFFSFLKKRREIKKQHQLPIQEHVHDESCGPEFANPIPKDIKVKSIAILLDNVVVDIMNAQEGLSDMLLKNPTFVEIDSNQERPHPGWVYEDGKFIPFEQITDFSSITLRR